MAYTAGTWVPVVDAGIASTTTVDSTQKYDLLRKVKVKDTGSTGYGFGELIYLKGVASTVAGDVVVYDAAGATVRTVARSIGPVAVALAATVADKFGWYQVGGAAIVTAGTVSAATQAYLSATASSIDDAVVTGDLVYGMQITGATSSGQAEVVLSGAPYCGDTDNSA